MSKPTPRESIWRTLAAGAGAQVLGGALLASDNDGVISLAYILIGLGAFAGLVGVVALGVSLGIADREHRARPTAPHPLLRDQGAAQ